MLRLLRRDVIAVRVGDIDTLIADIPQVSSDVSFLLLHRSEHDGERFHLITATLLSALRDEPGWRLRRVVEALPQAPVVRLLPEQTVDDLRDLYPPPVTPALLLGPEGILGVVVDADNVRAVPAATDDDATIRRTPHLDAPSRLATAPGSSFRATVWLDDGPGGDEEYGADILLDSTAGVRRVVLGVELIVSAHFELLEPHRRSLVVERGRPSSTPVLFDVAVSARPPDRPAAILALFSHEGRPCGSVSRTWDWNADTAHAPPLPGHTAAAVLPLHVRARRPDIAVTITAPVADGQHFHCGVETLLVPGYESGRTREFGLPVSADRFIAERLGRLTDPAVSPAERRRNLKEVGYRFWKAAPAHFQEAIWRIMDSGNRPRSLFVASVEPGLPWELMIPHRNVGGLFEERPPLGVEFAIGRWSRADSASPPQRLPVHNTFVLAPRYRPGRTLPWGSAEARFVVDHLNGVHVTPVTVDNLDAYFLANGASLVHFVGHGSAGRDPVLLLDDEEPLRSDALFPLDGFKALFRRHAPIVFLNACETGRTVPDLGNGTGFPGALGDLGARAILAPLWPVNDYLAHRIAVELYRRALEPGAPPVAELLRVIRQEAYRRDDAETLAAYAFYGDPLARLELVTPANDHRVVS